MSVEDAFRDRILRDVRQAKDRYNYNPTYFLRMIGDMGEVEAVKALLCKKEPSEGFTKLWELGRLDLTAEYLVLEDEFRELFTEEERDIARRRLTDHGFEF